jgi:hypothetical protein
MTPHNEVRAQRRPVKLLHYYTWMLLLALSTAAHTCWADPQSKSFSSWQLSENSQEGIYTIMAREVTRLPAYQFNSDLNQVLIEHLSAHILLSADGINCSAKPPQALRAKEGFLRVALSFQCPINSRVINLTIRAIFNVAASHIHFAKVTLGDKPISERLFTRRQLSHPLSVKSDSAIAGPADKLSILSTYALFGFEHILIGPDHIAFLITLMLLASRLRDIMFIVTGFTIGHSVTLSLTVLGLTAPNSMVVEAFIGFTIAVIAAENIAVNSGSSKTIALASAICISLAALWNLRAGDSPTAVSLLGLALFSYCYLSLSNTEQRVLKLRPTITILFGLIHGFGFASVLMEVGLPNDSLLPALLGFNIGVEFGQIVIVCVLVAIGHWLLKRVGLHRQLSVELLSAALCGLGVYWFIQRLYF